MGGFDKHDQSMTSQAQYKTTQDQAMNNQVNREVEPHVNQMLVPWNLA